MEEMADDQIEENKVRGGGVGEGRRGEGREVGRE